jgi:cbb3-type cytochrome oxidase subunit 1
MMERFVSRFIRSSLIWLGAGVLIGVWMAFHPADAYLYRPAHMHANLLGFVSMMIFGVAYHVIPRFSGSPLYNPRLAGTHVVVANIGLALMVAGWIAREVSSVGAAHTLRLGATLSAIGAGFFIYNLWRTLNAGEAATAARMAAPRMAGPGNRVPR